METSGEEAPPAVVESDSSGTRVARVARRSLRISRKSRSKVEDQTPVRPPGSTVPTRKRDVATEWERSLARLDSHVDRMHRLLTEHEEALRGLARTVEQVMRTPAAPREAATPSKLTPF